MRDERPETGAMKFGEDWTGVFIRGDDAMPYALALQRFLEAPPHSDDDATNPMLAKMVLKGLVEVLLSSEEGSKQVSQQLKKFDECLITSK